MWDCCGNNSSKFLLAILDPGHNKSTKTFTSAWAPFVPSYQPGVYGWIGTTLSFKSLALACMHNSDNNENDNFYIFIYQLLMHLYSNILSKF